jgi:hypothetical protein
VKFTPAQLRAGKKLKTAYLAFLLRNAVIRARAMEAAEGLAELKTKENEPEHKEKAENETN